MTFRRTTAAALDQLADVLSDRDRHIVDDLARVRVLTGEQLTRLHFADLSAASRDRTRRRVLARLVSLKLLTTLERRIGGVRAGSRGLVYALNATGQRFSAARSPGNRPRRPWTPGRLFLKHTLAVSELYVQLRALERAGELQLTTFEAEPASWHPDGSGGRLKPDAYIVVRSSDAADAYWLEQDEASEGLPTIKRKLLVYVQFARSGQVGPGGVIPRVLVSVPNEARRAAVAEVIACLPDPAFQFIHCVIYPQVVKQMSSVVNNIVDYG
ncbi:replication-relaxation family protein [Amycolatopsis sp., V23-08]|uniref:Replication-relaxation family protein n=1 Tax=Amycolatopsis heterodermiae TaxID=3110235 RepID=A0ABU5QZ45_9PSEU|nr:replication-relaxation family protein [Amycolatopsis sp., V23-08]MEA5358764.1 replication-relaxation family protein [Amycolatopsis sp., V23-08]